MLKSRLRKVRGLTLVSKNEVAIYCTTGHIWRKVVWQHQPKLQSFWSVWDLQSVETPNPTFKGLEGGTTLKSLQKSKVTKYAPDNIERDKVFLRFSALFCAFSLRLLFQFLLPFLSAILSYILGQTLSLATTCPYYSLWCDSPELNRWCWCSLRVGIQISSDEVVFDHDGCHHSVVEGTVDVPTCLLWQILSARTALLSRPSV